MTKTHQWMLFFLFLFFASAVLACTKETEKLVFYQTTQIQKMDDSKEDTQFLQEEVQTSQVSESSLHETTQAVETIAVYLCGEVCNPGVYVLQAGSRLYQAVEEAGGLTANARAEAVNLARILLDSEQIYIPNIAESIDQIEKETQNVISPEAIVSSASSDNLLNINQASESELMQLPGIGQVKAAAIVTYRNSNGPFSSIEEIKNVPGIKEAAFDKIKGMITVF